MRRVLEWVRALLRRRPSPPEERTLDAEKQHGVDLMYRSGDSHHLP